MTSGRLAPRSGLGSWPHFIGPRTSGAAAPCGIALAQCAPHGRTKRSRGSATGRGRVQAAGEPRVGEQRRPRPFFSSAGSSSGACRGLAPVSDGERGRGRPANVAQGGLRDGRARAAAGRHAHRPSLARPSGRPTLLARRETSGIAGRYTAMTVKVREWTKGKQVGFEVDIRFTYPDGAPLRQRIKAPVESKSAAKRWGEARERELLIRPSPVVVQRQEEQRKEVPTLREFAPRAIVQHARANRQKASTIYTKERIFENHLYPALGDRQLDRITDELVQKLKADLGSKAPKTVNNILTVLGKTLRLAVKWKVIGTMPCTIELLKVSNLVPEFYEFADYRRLVDAARALDPRALLVVLLGGDAGLRASEMMGLRGEDVDLRRR